MELEEMKNAWSRYDKQLSENIRLNEELLRQLNLDKSKREMDTPMKYEIISVIINVAGLLYLISATIQYSWEMKFLLPGIVTCVLMALLTWFSIDRLRIMSSVDYYNSTVVELQKGIQRIKKRFVQYRKIEFIIFPVFVLFAMPILAIALRHFDIYGHLWRYGIGIVMALVLGYSGMIWIYKNWYEKKMKNASDFLAELERFEGEA